MPPYRRRTIMLIVFNLCQTVGYYGFNNWVPALMAAQGASFTHSLKYSFIVALASPTVPLLFYKFADRTERKWQLVGAACGIAIFGGLFTLSTAPAWLILCGIALTTANNLLSYSFHAYQPELFPTRVRARAVGFVYSFSRLSTIFSSFAIAYFLAHFGAPGVFALHRRGDAWGGGVDRRVRAAHARAGAGADLALSRRVPTGRAPRSMPEGARRCTTCPSITGYVPRCSPGRRRWRLRPRRVPRTRSASA